MLMVPTRVTEGVAIMNVSSLMWDRLRDKDAENLLKIWKFLQQNTETNFCSAAAPHTHLYSESLDS